MLGDGEAFEMLTDDIATMGSGRFRLPAVPFQPSLVGEEASGVLPAIVKCDASIRTDLHASVVLSGGATMFADTGEGVTEERLAAGRGRLGGRHRRAAGGAGTRRGTSPCRAHRLPRLSGAARLGDGAAPRAEGPRAGAARGDGRPARGYARR